MTAAPTRVFLAHDDRAFGRTLGWVLEDNGYHVSLGDTGREVLAQVEAVRPDLLLVETGDAEAGLRLLAWVKSDDRFEDLPVLVLTPFFPEEGARQALGLAESDFVTKPYQVRDILARVRAHVRASRERDRVRAEARSRSEIVEIMRAITGALSPDEIYQVLVRRVAQGLGISRCSILLKGDTPDTGIVVAAYENPTLRNLAVDLSRYPELRRAFETGQVVLSDSVASDPLFAATRAEWQREGKDVKTTSALAIPFTMRGERAGVFFLRTSGRDMVLNQLDVQFAEQAIRSAVITIEKAYELQEAVEGERHLRALAETDPLTGLLTARALESRLTREIEQAATTGSVLSCLILRIEGFAGINATRGHQVGDLVLKQVAGLLTREQRAIDAVGRLGTADFCLMLPLTGEAGARLLADRLLQRIAGFAFGSPNQPLPVAVAIGMGTWPDARATDAAGFLLLTEANLLDPEP